MERKRLTGDEVMLVAARVAALREKQIALLKELAVSLDVEAAVPEGAVVVSLRFMVSKLSHEQREQLRRAKAHHQWLGRTYKPRPESPWCGPWIDYGTVAMWHNVAVLADGTEVVLSPMIRSAAARELPAVDTEGGDGLHTEARF